MAARVHAEWVAVHVETPRDQRLSPAEREDILRALELAEQLGGRAGHVERAERRPRRSWRTPAQHNVTRIVIGQDRPSAWRELFRGSLLDALVRGSGDIEVLAHHAARRRRASASVAAPRSPPRLDRARVSLAAAAIAMVPDASSGSPSAGRGVTVPPIDAAMLYLLAVVVAPPRAFAAGRRSSRRS